MKTSLVLALLVLAVAATSTPALAGNTYDHLKCFKIRDSLTDRRTIYLADIFPESTFAAQSDCRLRLPALHFCVNVAKGNVQVNGEPFDTVPVPGAEESRDYLCYDLKCDRDRLDLDALDQFGARPLRVRKSDFLCMPANKILVGSTPTPTPTETPTPEPTSTPVPNLCGLLDQGAPGGGDGIVAMCGGDCPTGETCVSAGDLSRTPDDCFCAPIDQACGEQTIGTGQQLPICGGLCPSPFAVCMPDASRGTLSCNCTEAD